MVESHSSVWLAVCGAASDDSYISGSLVNLQKDVTGSWSVAYNSVPPGEIGMRSITAIWESGAFNLFMINEPSSDGTQRNSSVYIFNPDTQLFTEYATTNVDQSGVWKSVTTAPFDQLHNASPSSAATSTVTAAQTASASRLPSLSVGASPYPSSSASITAVVTPTPPSVLDGNSLMLVRIVSNCAGVSIIRIYMECEL
jgi:hypothetical protein